MSLESICICTVTRMVRGCPRHAPGDTGTPESHHAMLIRIIENQEKIMTAQDDINAAVTAIQAVTSDLVSAAGNIQTEIANLNSQLAAAGQPQVDTTALNAAIAPLQAAQKAVDALETPASTTPPAPGSGTPAPVTPAEPAPVAAGDSGTSQSAS